MNKKLRGCLSAVVCAGMLFTSIMGVVAFERTDLTTSGKLKSLNDTDAISNDAISTVSYKSAANNNPISSEIFCADPTSVEYDGRLYVYGTNDHQQYDEAGPDKDNTYEKIKSFVIYSTDDMVNWVYHGEINTKEIAPWIINSWAPSITSRVEDDGLTHFYLYFSNNGLGVGVLTSTSPTGPWSDPLGQPLVSSSTPGLTNCPNPFDPGVVIDENGQGWLSFGGGRASTGTEEMPGSARIVKLGDDMLSFASDFAEIPAPYFFEASELNYINGTYVYTYNTSWVDHPSKWDYDCESPSQCSMVYMTTKTPLDPNSWVMGGEYFKNPGTAGFDYSNNHTHLQKYKDNYYILYHTLSLKSSMGITAGCRSLCVDQINVDEENVVIEKIGGTKKGVKAVSTVDPYLSNPTAINNTAEISFDTSDNNNPAVVSDNSGSWVSVKRVGFGGAETDEPIDLPAPSVLTNIDTITYDITVTSVDKDTTISMYPSAKGGSDCEGSVSVTGNGNYTITCNLEGASQMQNLGYFRASDDAKVTFTLNKIIVNGEYEMEITSVLTNTTAWADGLKNIWNFPNATEDETVYSCDMAALKYVVDDGAIELFTVDKNLIPTTEPREDDGGEVKENLSFLANVKGTGRIEVRLDKMDGELLTFIDFKDLQEYTTVFTDEVAAISGTHDLYFVFSDKDISLKYWQFTDQQLVEDLTTVEKTSDEVTSEPTTVTEPTTASDTTQEQPTTVSEPTTSDSAATTSAGVTSAATTAKPSQTTVAAKTTTAASGSGSSSTTSTIEDKPIVNTGAKNAVGMTGFMLVGALGAIALVKRKK